MADNDWQQQVLMNEGVFSAITPACVLVELTT